MKCPECAADVNVLREFCPSCGAVLHRDSPARRPARPSGRPSDQLNDNRKKLLIGGGAILLALAALGKLSLPGIPIHVDIDNDRKGPALVEAQQVYEAYRDDEDAAAKRFADREMVVTGEFLRIVPDGYGSLDMRLKTSNPEAPLGIDLAGIAIEDAKKLRPGQRVTVSCQGMGGGGDDPWVRECAIQSAADAPSGVPAPPAPPAPPPPPPGGGN
jgi:hypothetical protein